MPLTTGTRLGSYEIVALIGEGGMGQVYRATDTRLGRDVAIKILPEMFAADPERLARFEREARALAALNHPNVAHIHGLEETPRSDGGRGLRALVMELVEGDDLAVRIARGAIPLSEALPIARQIALALEAAHEHGIIHRDLKPANIKVTNDGTVKVLDFGLAKAMDPAGASGAAAGAVVNSPTLTARATELGLILGTAAYMAPEQARGKSVDRRADIWSFGVVVTEMLTGERAFKGDDITEVLAKVIEREPDFARLPANTPPGLRRLLTRCLNKDPKQRLRDIGEARILLDEIAAEPRDQPTASKEHAAVSNRKPVSRALPWIVAAASLAAAGYGWTRNAPPPASASPNRPARLQIALPAGIDLYSVVGSAMSLSPDGSTLAFVGVQGGVRQIFLRQLDSFEVTPVRGTLGCVSAVFSPDGKELLFGASDTSLRRVRLSDGFIVLVAKGSSDYLGSWFPDGRIVYGGEGRIWITGATPDAPPRKLTEPTPGSTAVEAYPAVVPGTEAIVFAFGRPEGIDSARIEALRLSDLKRTTVLERAVAPVFTSTGHLLFLRDGDEFAVKFDRATLKTVGEPVRILQGMTVVRNRGVASVMTVSGTGMLVYASAAATHSELVTVSRQGEERTLLRMDRGAANPRMSPDGRRVIFEEVGGGLWLYDIERKVESRLTDGAAIAGFPIFGPGGREVIYRSGSGLFRQPLDGSTRAAQIQGTGPSEFASGLSSDGVDLLYTRLEPSSAGDVYRVPVAGGSPEVLLNSPAYEGGAQVSPDGHWLVYVSNELGQNEIFVQGYPKADRRLQVSSAGGMHPTWNPKGGEIFYRLADDMFSVRMTVTPAGPSLAPPVKLFTARYGFGGGLTIPNYAVMPDGERFVMVKEQSRAILNVVLNWFEELKNVR